MSVLAEFMVQHYRQTHVCFAAWESRTTTATRDLHGNVDYASNLGVPSSHGSHISHCIFRSRCDSVRGSADKLYVHVLDRCVSPTFNGRGARTCNIDRLLFQVLLFRVSCHDAPSDPKRVESLTCWVQVRLDRSRPLPFEEGEVSRRTVAVLFRVRVSFCGSLHMGEWPRKRRPLCIVIPCGAYAPRFLVLSRCLAELSFCCSILSWLCTPSPFPRTRSTHSFLWRRMKQCAIPRHLSRFGSLYFPL